MDGNWLIIELESKTEDDSVIKRAVEAAGGRIIWSGDKRPLVQVRLPSEEARGLDPDPRLSKPL